MENNETFFFAAGGVLNGIAHLTVIIACIILVLKRKSAPTILMLVAQLLVLFLYVGSFAWTAIAARQGAETLVWTSKIIAMLGPFPYILFAAGLLWFVITLAKKRTDAE